MEKERRGKKALRSLVPCRNPDYNMAYVETSTALKIMMV
jgi:hypothetical protein